jgi:hypothetical protein
MLLPLRQIDACVYVPQEHKLYYKQQKHINTRRTNAKQRDIDGI